MTKILEIAHEMARDLLEVGVMDEITMRKMEALCLPPKRSLNPERDKRIRARNHVSQAVFAAFLGTGKTTVQQWEQRIKKPSGPAQRLLDFIDRHGLVALCK